MTMNSNWQYLAGWLQWAASRAGQNLAPRVRMNRPWTNRWAWLPALLAWPLLTGALAAGAEPPLLKLQPVPFREVEIRDSFWAPRRETNRIASIPFSLQKLEEAGNLEDMRLAGRGATNGFRGPVFMDSDLYKALESAAYSLATHPDPALDKQVDDIIVLLAAAQQPDGYLNSHFTVKKPDKRLPKFRIFGRSINHDWPVRNSRYSRDTIQIFGCRRVRENKNIISKHHASRFE